MPFEIGNIYYLLVNQMFAMQANEKWLKITNSPGSDHGSARPFVYLYEGHSSDWSIWVPLTSSTSATPQVPPYRTLIPINALTWRAQFPPQANHKQLWEIPNDFVSRCEENFNRDGSHRAVLREFIDETLQRNAQSAITKILSSYATSEA